MTVPPTSSGEGDPGQVTRIAEEFIRLHEAGQLTDLDEFCGRYPEDQRDQVRQECEQLLRIQGVIKQPDRLTSGQILASYEIVESIGKGGMGEVYRAKDPELDREIAIKVLPPELACQPERVRRFKREAKAIAALDHPNIVTVYSVEESDGLHFITMQLVQGKMLSELIPKKGLPLEKFFDLAIPLADAISSAHEQGITHRDLKPANIMVTADGRVEILDFGLAKLRPQVTAEGPTEMPVSSLTIEGQIVGTVAYMSPEQAEGRNVDHRTDIFSLGIILYEMVTGQRPFKGESRVALMSSIMKDTPTAVRELSPQVPNHLGRIIRRSLEKDPERRFQTGKDLRNELTDLKSEIDSGGMVAQVEPIRARSWLWPAISGVLLVVLVLVLVVPRPVPSSQDSARVVATQLTILPGVQSWPSISPDGERFVYRNDDDIYERPVAGGIPRNLTTDNPETADYQAAFHPREDKIAYRRAGSESGIWVIETTGARPRRITNQGFHPAWSPDGSQLVYTTANGSDPYHLSSGIPRELRIVDVATSQDRLLSGERYPTSPSWSPNGKWIAFSGGSGTKRDIWIISPEGDDPRQLTNNFHHEWSPFWSPDGDLLYFISDREEIPSLWAVRIDEDSGVVQGSQQNIWTPDRGRIREGGISGDGSRIVCTVRLTEYRIQSFQFDPEMGQLAEQAIEGTDLYFTNRRSLQYLSVSPDDRWLAFCTDFQQQDVFVIRADGTFGGEPLPVTYDAYRDGSPTWFPMMQDGLWLTFHSNRSGSTQIHAAQPGFAGVEQLATQGGGGRWWPDGSMLWTPRGVYLFFDGLLGEAAGPSSGGFNPSANGSWSRDGKLLAKTAEPGGPPLTVHSGDRGLLLHGVDDPDGEPYNIYHQHGNRWLDNTRLIFWDEDLNKAYLWDADTLKATPIDGLDHPGEYVFSEDGRTLFGMQLVNSSSDIWLIEVKPPADK